MADFSMDGYIDVAERITLFRSKYPEGCLQPLNPDRPYWIEVVEDKTFIVYVAAAYRTPDDKLPGIGVAWEPFPGPTQFTRDSELMNAETGAWGRAIVASLAADTKKIATAEDVRNRGESKPGSAGSVRKATDKQRRLLEMLIEKHTVPEGCEWPLADDLSMRDCSGFIDQLKALPDPPVARTKKGETLADTAQRLRVELDAEMADGTEPF